MGLYEDIVRERATKGPDYRNGLLALEASRNYKVCHNTTTNQFLNYIKNVR